MFVTSEGHPGVRLQRALAAGNIVAAEQAAFEVAFVPLTEASALVELYAEMGDRRFERAALKYLRRYLDEADPSAIYLVVLGAWESLGENYKGVDIVDVQSENYGDAHALYDVGVGAAHMAGFANAAFVGATAAALLASATPWRRLGGIGVGLTVVWLINAPLQIFATSDWSDAVGAIVFLSLLAWVFALSVVLLIVLRRSPGERSEVPIRPRFGEMNSAKGHGS